MSQAKVTKRAKFLDNFMVREPQHNSEGHIFDPNELEIPRVIVDVEVTKPPAVALATWCAIAVGT